tara:strand:- start:143 stop:397 length:255 start_codon:yes stop_codon:yes gene_type:complete
LKNLKNRDMRIETFEDGWDCLPELKEVVETIEELDTYKYEINNCVRVTELDYMVTQMKDLLEEALSKLEDINTNKEFVTVIDND